MTAPYRTTLGAVEPHEHEPNEAGTACRHCNTPAERADISPDALVLLARYAATDHTGNRARWTVARIQADIDRRRAFRARWGTIGQAFSRPNQEALATVAPSTNPAERDTLPDDPENERQRGAALCWAAILHARQLMREQPDRTDYADWTAAQYAASHDAHTERDLLAGRMDADGRVWERFPPLYRAGMTSDGPYPNPARVTPTGPGHITGLQPE
jgi:hypothetical protein